MHTAPISKPQKQSSTHRLLNQSPQWSHSEPQQSASVKHTEATKKGTPRASMKQTQAPVKAQCSFLPVPPPGGYDVGPCKAPTGCPCTHTPTRELGRFHHQPEAVKKSCAEPAKWTRGATICQHTCNMEGEQVKLPWQCKVIVSGTGRECHGGEQVGSIWGAGLTR